MIDYLHEFVKAYVADTRNACEFVQATGERNWDPKRDMYWKLSGNKRTDVWDFLFEPGPLGPTDLEYSRRRNLLFVVLNGYHDAPRESVSHFLRRLEHVYFTLAELLTLENYKSQFDEEDPFDAEDMEELSDSETFDFESMPLPRVVGQARTALVEHLSLMNPERNDQDVDAYAEQKLRELYANNMLEFRAPFYALETALSRGTDWRMPQPPSAGQHPGGGGGGDEGDGGGGEGDGSQLAGKGTGETSSVEKASGGKGSDGKGSGGKGSGGKGSGGKRRTSGSPQYMETDRHCVGSRDSDMRDEATLTSNQRSPVLNTLLLKEGASSFCLEGRMPALRRSEGAISGSLGSGDRYKLRIHSDLLTSPYAISAPHSTVPRGEENVTSSLPHVQLDTGLPCTPSFSCVETRDWRSRDVVEGPAPGVLETGGSENERHTPGEDERSPGTRVVHREEETQCWQSRKVLETGGSECERHASEGASVDTDSESAGAPGETHVGVVKGGQWTSVQAPVLGDDEDEEEPVAEARVHGDEKGGEPVVEGSEVTVDIRTDPQRKDGDSSPTRCGEEQGGRASVLSTARGMVLHEAIDLGDDSAATELVSDSGVAEMQNVESFVEGGEVAVSIKMDPERKDHDSLCTRCGAEQGDRASVLSTGREMVLHEPIDLPSDTAATELVSDTAVAEVQNLESSVDVGAVAR
ncbi:hypothetical protein CBR_g6480 [Chara braunii]|uniref:Uncharacterized protein n=1 Tax=Chara braunii TaxID=69332 RepID=A0A388KJW8_CHABU|nr:hypothetical protein CBR_g6480 [Chara braunii]|eukprot:GBG70352.1 hypothetical protein CBR_g6480 [Chara braunii]